MKLPAQLLTVNKHINPLLWLTLLPVNKDAPHPICHLKERHLHQEHSQNGDVIIGGLLQLSRADTKSKQGFTLPPKSSNCIFPSLQYFQHLLVFMFAVEEINQRADILPNVTLGYVIYDSCVVEWKALQNALTIISGRKNIMPNYNCYKKRMLAGFIGHRMLSSSMTIASVTGLYRYPQISYGNQHSLPRRREFPSLYHMFPHVQSHYTAIIQLLNHFGWTWVGIVSSEDENGQLLSVKLKEMMTQHGICTEFLFTAFNKVTGDYEGLKLMLARSTSKAIIFTGHLDESNILAALTSEINLKKVFIFPFNFPYDVNPLVLPKLNGSLLLHLSKVEIPGLKDFIISANPNKYPDLPLMATIWEDTFKCLFGGRANVSENVCSGKEKMSTLKSFQFDIDNLRVMFQVYAAVYALSYALHEMHTHITDKSVAGSKSSWKAWKLNYYLRNLSFQTLGGETVFFNQDETSPVKFDFVNLVVLPNSKTKEKIVGYYFQNTKGYQLWINISDILWNPFFSKIPSSVCTASCPVGYHKIQLNGFHKCCYDCDPCSEGEIANTSDQEECFKCLEYQWPNDQRNTCIPMHMEFLSFEETMGSCLVIVTLFLIFLTIIVFGLFLKHKNTAIVKANNPKLSFILLLFLSFSFLCPLLFIGRPTELSCHLRQVAFGIIFTLSVSSVLAKTFTVVLAFRASKPNWILRNCLGKQCSIYVMIMCSVGQFLICATWLIFSPPVLEFNTQVETGKIVMQCNEGSGVTLYIVIAYIGCLALLSFIVAFLARKLPDTFNEAQNITFSMLVFCSVWITFIPVYVSTKGKSTVAVEVFAILASSAGLFGCIFIPKCYIILIRPELNKKSKLKSKWKLRHPKCSM